MTRRKSHNKRSLLPQEKAIIIFLDLDRFGEVMEERGWTRYAPNVVTGTLTTEVETLAKKHWGVIHWGVNPAEGTEEAVIMINHIELEAILPDLELLRQKVENQGITTISIGVAVGPTGTTPKELKTGKREHTLLSSPAALMAKRALKKAKKKRNSICIEYA